MHWAPEHLSARLAAADELVVLGERTGDAEIELHGRHWRVVDLLDGGEVAAAASEIVRYEREAAEARLPAFAWYVPAWRAALAGYRGDLAARGRLADQAQAGRAHRRRQRASSWSRPTTTRCRSSQEAWGEFDLSYVRAADRLAGGSVVPGLPRALPGRARRRRGGASAAGRRRRPRDSSVCRATPIS